MSNTRFILTGVGALALLGASVVPSVPSFAAEGNAGAQTQQAISTLRVAKILALITPMGTTQILIQGLK